MYTLWAWRFVERFPESDLQVSREERLREGARHAQPGKLALVGILLCFLSALLVWLDPGKGWLGLLGVAAGAVLVWFAWILRRAAASPSP